MANMDTTVESTTPISGPFIIRLLNSSLNGCEFPLPQGRTLFIVGEVDTFISSEQIPVLPVDSLFIPLEQGGVNFELVVDENLADDKKITLHELTPESIGPRSVVVNSPIQVGELLIVIRPEGQPWVPSIPAKSEITRVANYLYLKKGMIITLACIVILAISIAGTFWVLNAPQRQVAELDSLLGKEKERFLVLPGRDKVFYILSKNEGDSLWARQVIARGDYSKVARVIDEYEENKRVSTWLDTYYPRLAYYRLHLDNPREPIFWISRQRVKFSKIELDALSKKLVEIMPYADSVSIVSMDDITAAEQAESGLKQQALPYSRKNNKDSVTFVIQGALDDTEILRARQFVDSYYRTWGDRYIQFAIELKDDWLKGRSFQYGAEGYVKMSSGHWYFPSPM